MSMKMNKAEFLFGKKAGCLQRQLEEETGVKWDIERTCKILPMPYQPGGWEGYYCSNCNVTDEELEFVNYCWNCGAKITEVVIE